MKKYRRYLPSLDSLVFFEAAARNCNFTHAAKELYVTQAAVSKRVRELEHSLGSPLFIRDGRRLELTQTGQCLNKRLFIALGLIEESCRIASLPAKEPVRVATCSSVMLFWLSDRLKEFSLGECSVHFSLTTLDQTHELIDIGNDIIIVYSSGLLPGWNCELLVAENLVPVASPEYLSKHKIDPGLNLSEMQYLRTNITLLDYEKMSPDWINFHDWLERVMPDEPIDHFKVSHRKTYSHCIGDAIDGKGIALGSLDLLKVELERGRLCKIGSQGLDTKCAYYLATPAHKGLSRNTLSLKNWLLDSVNNWRIN